MESAPTAAALCPFVTLHSYLCCLWCGCGRKLQFRRYDPVVRQHVIFEESKMR